MRHVVDPDFSTFRMRKLMTLQPGTPHRGQYAHPTRMIPLVRPMARKPQNSLGPGEGGQCKIVEPEVMMVGVRTVEVRTESVVKMKISGSNGLNKCYEFRKYLAFLGF